jgi:hypothetical protein
LGLAFLLQLEQMELAMDLSSMEFNSGDLSALLVCPNGDDDIILNNLGMME